MKTLPKSFGIKRDASNPLWKKYVKWLNTKHNSVFNGMYPNYYGIDMTGVIVALPHECSFDTILTLEEWDSIVNGWQPKKGEMVEVRDNEWNQWQPREFLAMDGDRFVCRHLTYPSKFFAYIQCRPVNSKKKELEESIARMEKELAEMKSKLEE